MISKECINLLSFHKLTAAIERALAWSLDIRDDFRVLIIQLLLHLMLFHFYFCTLIIEPTSFFSFDLDYFYLKIVIYYILILQFLQLFSDHFHLPPNPSLSLQKTNNQTETTIKTQTNHYKNKMKRKHTNIHALTHTQNL
jgi:hypothetical protein